jgi:hypothetical protein
VVVLTIGQLGLSALAGAAATASDPASTAAAAVRPARRARMEVLATAHSLFVTARKRSAACKHSGFCADITVRAARRAVVHSQYLAQRQKCCAASGNPA